MYNCVTHKNIDKFLHEFEITFRMLILAKEIRKDGIKKGTIPKNSKDMTVHPLKWTDD